MNRALWCVVALLCCPPAVIAQDGVDMRAAKTGLPDEVRLDWTGGYAPYTVYRSTDAASVVDPANEIGTTSGMSWLDVPPAGTLWFYRVTSPCVWAPEVCDAQDNDCDRVVDEGCATCVLDGDCAAGEHCSTAGTCIVDDVVGSPCSRNAQCLTDACVDGVCCDTPCTGICRACDISGTTGTCENVPVGEDPDAECGAISCGGYYYGWLGDTCFRRADVSASSADCGGDGACETVAEACSGSGQGAAQITCDSLCQDPSPGTCQGTTQGACTNVNPGTQTCGLGVCERTVNRCANGLPQPCIPGTPSSETCNDLDDDCDGAVDDNLSRDWYETNETCGTVRSLATVGSNQTQTYTDMTLYGSGDVDTYRFVAVETDSTCSCCDFWCIEEDYRVEVTLTVPYGAGSYWLCTAQQGTCPATWNNCIEVAGGSSGSHWWTLDGSCWADDSYQMYVHVSGATPPGFDCQPYTLRYRLLPGCF